MPSKKEESAEAMQRAVIVASKYRVITALQHAHMTTAKHTDHKKTITTLFQQHPEAVQDTLRRAALRITSLAPELPPEVINRHISFVTELCKEVRSTMSDDALAASLISTVLPYHNATDKAVRHCVVGTVANLLKALKSEIDPAKKAARDDLHDSIVTSMQDRAMDKAPAVREQAVGALCLFQQASVNDDITQLLLALLCEDSSADVRRGILLAIHPQREVFFAPVARLTRDKVATVRMAAWDMLGQYKLARVAAFAKKYNVKLCRLLVDGLHDASQLVRNTAHTALCAGWLTRDCDRNCAMLLAKLELDGAEAAHQHASEVASTVLKAAMKAVGEKIDAQVGLNKGQLNIVGTLLWRAWVVEKLAAPTGDDADPTAASVLPPLAEFSLMLRDVASTFADPARNAHPNRTVTLEDPYQAEAILQVLLSMFTLYEEQGFLAHCDDASRASMIKPLQRLLTTVLETDTAIFVDDIMRAVRGLFHRHPLEALDCVGEAVRRLFDTLKLPKECGLTYDDAEVFGQRDKQRREELARLRTRRGAEELIEPLQDAITNDTLYMYRMQHIVHQFLAHMNRSAEKVPSFCHSVIQLGRSLDDEGIREIATRSLCLELLMSPDSVNTFVPVLVREVSEPGHSRSRESALTSLFDVAAEYGLAFFQVTGAAVPRPQNGAAASSADDAPAASTADADLQRARLEQAASADDAKFGGSALLHKLLGFMQPSAEAPDPAMRRIAMVGTAKLLSCSRLVGPDAVAGLAWLLLATYITEGTHAQRNRGDALSAEVVKIVEYFLSVYASSHHRRMRLVAEGGMLAVRIHLANGLRAPTEALCVQRLIRKVVQYTDASLLASIRDLDPQFAAAVRRDQQAQEAANEDGAAPDATGSSDAPAQRKAAPARKSTASPTNEDALAAAGVRLRRELGRHSTHEYLAREILLEIATVGAPAALCLGPALGLLRLYRPDPYTLSVLEHFAARATGALDAIHSAHGAIQSMLAAYRASVGNAAAADVPDGRPSRQGPQAEWDTAADARAALLAIHAPPVSPARASARRSGRKTERSLTRAEDEELKEEIAQRGARPPSSSEESAVALPARRRRR